MYQEDQYGNITITLNHQNYDSLLLCLGYAAGSALKQSEYRLADSFLQLANVVNQGNSQWRPYATTSSHH